MNGIVGFICEVEQLLQGIPFVKAACTRCGGVSANHLAPRSNLHLVLWPKNIKVYLALAELSFILFHFILYFIWYSSWAVYAHPASLRNKPLSVGGTVVDPLRITPPPPPAPYCPRLYVLIQSQWSAWFRMYICMHIYIRWSCDLTI